MGDTEQEEFEAMLEGPNGGEVARLMRDWAYETGNLSEMMDHVRAALAAMEG